MKRWSWLRHAKKVKDHTVERKNRKFLGIKAIILGELTSDNQQRSKLPDNKENMKSSANNTGQKTAQNGQKNAAPAATQQNGKSRDDLKFAKQYITEGRKLALTLCSWDFASDEGLQNKLQKLCVDGE